MLRTLVPTLQRGNAYGDALASRFAEEQTLTLSFCACYATLERRSMRSHAGAWERECVKGWATDCPYIIVGNPLWLPNFCYKLTTINRLLKV